MPGFDGTGPRGLGPMTGGSRGYCAIAFRPATPTQTPYGYVGLQGTPVRFAAQAMPMRWPMFCRRYAFAAMRRGWPRGGFRGTSRLRRWW